MGSSGGRWSRRSHAFTSTEAAINWFKLYIGDYQRDTAHLSVTEHGAYLLMLQHYYATEKPLPTGKALHRMLRAQDKAEREAIDTVAAQFWTETPDGLVNDRADAEITKAGAQAETNRAIAQAREARRKASRTEHEQSTNRSTNVQPNQTPDTRHQTEIPERAATSTEVAREPDTGGHEPTPAGLVCRAMRKAGMPDVNPGDPRLLALIAQGATAAEFEGLAAEAVSKGKGFAWVLVVLSKRREEAAAITLAPPVPERPEASGVSPQVEATRRMLAERDAIVPTKPPAEVLALVGRIGKVSQ